MARPKRRKRPSGDRMLACLKKCMFKEDQKAHRNHDEDYLESKEHTDDLLDVCVPRCKPKRRKRPRRPRR